MPDRPTILLVDRKRFGRDLLRLVLAQEGYVVEAALTDAEALDALARHPVRAAVLNVHQPGDYPGLDLVKQIRALPRGAKLPILLLTDDQWPEVQEWARQVGVGDFCAKGVASLPEFTRRVRQILAAPSGIVRAAARETAVATPAGGTPAVGAGLAVAGASAAALPPAAERKLRTLADLPPLSGTSQELLLLVRKTDTPAQAILDILRRDRALTAQVLKVANSTFYGGRERVHTPERALVRLGLNGLRDLALGVTFAARMGRTNASPRLPAAALWEHSIGAAIVARGLAIAGGGCDPELAFVTGLLHDIGKDVFDELCPEEYDEVLREAETGGGLHEIERRRFGLDHGTLGARALRQWRIPLPIPEAVGLHHGPWPPPPDLRPEDAALAAVVRVANGVTKARRIGVTRHEVIEELPDAVAAAAGVGPAAMADLAAGLPAAVEELRAILLMRDPAFAATPAGAAAAGGARRGVWLEQGGGATRALLSIFLGSLDFTVFPVFPEGEECDLAVGLGLPAAEVPRFLDRAADGGIERVVLLTPPGQAAGPAPAGAVTVLPMPVPIRALEAACREGGGG